MKNILCFGDSNTFASHPLGGRHPYETRWTGRLQALLGKSTLLTAVGTSQVISNVPAAVLLSGFTEQWRPLLEGVNIGGLGTPIASLASLITLKLYLRWPGAKAGRFLAVFTLANVAGLVILLAASMLF